MKFSFLILFLLVLSGPAESAQESTGKIPNKQKISTTPEKDAFQDQGHSRTPTAFEKSLIETLRTIADQQKTDYEQQRADQKPWWVDPALLGVGFLYTVFAGFQWWEIRRQATIAAAGIKVARDAAKAAQESAKAVDAQLHVYRPFIVVQKPFTNSVKADPPLRRRMPTTVHIKVRNYGIGPADIVKYFVKAEAFDWVGDDPSPPLHAENEVCHTIDSVLKPEGENELITLWFDISEGDFAAMLNDTKRLAFHGIIYYRGGPEKIYWTRFFWWCILSAGEEIVRPKTPELNAHI